MTSVAGASITVFHNGDGSYLLLFGTIIIFHPPPGRVQRETIITRMELSRNELAALNMKYDQLPRDIRDVRSAGAYIVICDHGELSSTGDENSMKNSRATGAVHDLRCNAIPERPS